MSSWLLSDLRWKRRPCIASSRLPRSAYSSSIHVSMVACSAMEIDSAGFRMLPDWYAGPRHHDSVPRLASTILQLPDLNACKLHRLVSSDQVSLLYACAAPDRSRNMSDTRPDAHAAFTHPTSLLLLVSPALVVRPLVAVPTLIGRLSTALGTPRIPPCSVGTEFSGAHLLWTNT